MFYIHIYKKLRSYSKEEYTTWMTIKALDAPSSCASCNLLTMDLVKGPMVVLISLDGPPSHGLNAIFMYCNICVMFYK
ncbi:hypothetical protein Fmac_018226 [Flemingia macrophylla]|uniref:Uncharacterized protein n=1 Tax=Flemingia macrophylla TaxID=520843 RepID=A0ABD1M4D3_9FABA